MGNNDIKHLIDLRDRLNDIGDDLRKIYENAEDDNYSSFFEEEISEAVLNVSNAVYSINEVLEEFL